MSSESCTVERSEAEPVHGGEQPKLSERHRRLIQASAIDPGVALERGYRTVYVKARLRELGFGERQCRVPALLIPVLGVTGEIVTHQIRPDIPRQVKGKELKYETPRASRMALDVPRRSSARLGDPSVPLFITEGARKADAAVSRGLCTVALLGVWNWRGTNEFGGKTALPDWDALGLNGRDVYIVFDSDIVDKAPVRQAMERLKGMLESRGAKVRVVYLPSGEGATKLGLDDYFALGKSVDDLLALASPELRTFHRDDRVEQYEETEHGIVYNKPTREGTVPVPLTNFTAKIVREIVYDDGFDEARRFAIDVGLDGSRKTVEVPSSAFASMNWPIEVLGARAVVYAGFGQKEHARAAIQTLSAKVEQTRVYRHIGWRTIDGVEVYLHAGGAIGPNGEASGVEVALEDPLDRFRLELPASEAKAADAVRQSLALLDGLVPDCLAFPLFGLTPLAVLGGANFTTHLVGETGVRKTELAALVQRHYGQDMDADNLPGSWSSTANANELLASRAKDAVLVLDDFNPLGSDHDVRRAHRDADRVVRAQGNRCGRARMRDDASFRSARTPQGVILSTGEDVPAGHSARARMLVLEVEGGDVNLARLSERQDAAAHYPQATAAFVRWVSCRRRELQEAQALELTKERNARLGRVAHGRTATIGGVLLFAIRTYLLFAKDVGAIDEAQRTSLAGRAEVAVDRALAAQASHQRAATPAEKFLELLTSSLQAGVAHLVDLKSGGAPESDGRYGQSLAEMVGWSRVAGELRAHGPRVGWVDAEAGSVYLNPLASMKAARDSASGSVEGINVSSRMLHKALHGAGLLAGSDPGRHTKKVRVQGKHVRVLHLRLDSLFAGAGTTGTAGTDPPGEAATGPPFPEAVPDKDLAAGPANGNTGPQTGPGAGCVPGVPDVPDPGGTPPPQEEEGVMEAQPDRASKADPCFACGGTDRWRRVGGGEWFCTLCHSPAIPEAEVERSGEGAPHV